VESRSEEEIAMVTVSVLIECPADVVWSYLTTPENWYYWYCEDQGFGSAIGVEAVNPDWEKGADIVWSSIGSKPSRITKAVPGKELAFDAGWEGTIEFKMKPKGEAQTLFEIRKRESSTNAYGQKAGLEKMLQQFKARVEKEQVVS
jgi:uncharacterized protein YndB with AHSA1/START domain